MNVNERGTRPQRQVRAYPEEWEIIRRFLAIVRKDPARAQVLLDAMERLDALDRGVT